MTVLEYLENTSWKVLEFAHGWWRNLAHSTRSHTHVRISFPASNHIDRVAPADRRVLVVFAFSNPVWSEGHGQTDSGCISSKLFIFIDSWRWILTTLIMSSSLFRPPASVDSHISGSDWSFHPFPRLSPCKVKENVSRSSRRCGTVSLLLMEKIFVRAQSAVTLASAGPQARTL